jgi:hypothetical protein
MVSDELLYATLLACRYAAEANIPGDFVECGVWRGGNAILAADVFKRLAPTKKVYLFDTFAGMTTPTAHDGSDAILETKQHQRADHNEWCLCPLDEVRSNFIKYRLDAEFIVGDVMETLSAAPHTISVLRLDTDWYESTKYELETLYPRLCSGGVLMIEMATGAGHERRWTNISVGGVHSSTISTTPAAQLLSRDRTDACPPWQHQLPMSCLARLAR